MQTHPRMLLVSPCRNEARFISRSIESISNQTFQPVRWVIVDDGSTDDTPQLLHELSERVPWVSIVTRKDRGKRSVGPGVIDAFYEGLNEVDLDQFEYLCKLDLDVELPKRYFEILIERMERNPRLGTCSGKPYFPDESGRMHSERCGDENSVGMTKLFRTKCFEDIGGFVREVMWDGIDCHRCRMLGWIACSWDEPDLRFVHLRPMGSSQTGILTGRMRHGFGQYFMGTGFTYMTASALFRALHPPRVLGGLGMWLGYLRAMCARTERYDDPHFREFLRQYQWNCLRKGKSRATTELNDEQEVVWMSRFGRTALDQNSSFSIPQRSLGKTG